MKTLMLHKKEYSGALQLNLKNQKSMYLHKKESKTCLDLGL